jgi:hypothetical protein
MEKYLFVQLKRVQITYYKIFASRIFFETLICFIIDKFQVEI